MKVWSATCGAHGSSLKDPRNLEPIIRQVMRPRSESPAFGFGLTREEAIDALVHHGRKLGISIYADEFGRISSRRERFPEPT